MLSGRCIVVLAPDGMDDENVLDECCRRLGLADGYTMKLLDLSGEEVHDFSFVRNWPGLQPKGEISEYQLNLRQ
eukprot:5760591-Amphidinium_carterae.1